MKKEEILNSIKEILDVMGLQLKYNKKYNVFNFIDLLGVSNSIEDDTFSNIISCINRLINDYFYWDLQNQLDVVYNLKFTGKSYKDLYKFIEKHNLVNEFKFDYNVLKFVCELDNYNEILCNNEEIAELLGLENEEDEIIESMLNRIADIEMPF